MTDRLVRDFVSSWVFFKDLPELARSGSSERVRAAAAVCEREGIQPVDSLVLSPEGAFLGGIWVEDLDPWGPRADFIERPKPEYQGDGAQKFAAFLADMLGKAK